MEPIDQVKWDVVLTGTGLSESLLALFVSTTIALSLLIRFSTYRSLSRSNKHILHLDRNGYYGGAEAALSLRDVESWAKDVNSGVTKFEDGTGDGTKLLGPPSAYSLSLAPQIIYSRSNLIPILVSSKVYRQLEFHAVGSWWIYDASQIDEVSTAGAAPSLRMIPSRREDIFEDRTLDLKAKRALIKFLRLIMDPGAHDAAIEEFGDLDLQSYLTRQFGLASSLQAGLHALTLSPYPAQKTPLAYALSRISRHLGSFGVFGTGFSSVIPKWGGFAEIAQVACRALAVGGGVYILGTGVRDQPRPAAEGEDENIILNLDSGDSVRTAWVASSPSTPSTIDGLDASTRSITVVTSELTPVFPSLGDGAHKPAAAIVTFPAGSIDGPAPLDFPVYLMIHSSETGECPSGQAVIYGSLGTTAGNASQLLSRAIDLFLSSVGENPKDCIRYTLGYQQSGLHSIHPTGKGVHGEQSKDASADGPQQHDIVLPPPSLDLAFDDVCLDQIKAAWSKITGNEDDFMTFEDREKGAYDLEDQED